MTLPRAPYNLDVEQGFLADAMNCAVVRPEKIDFGALAEIVRPEDFYDGRNARIWDAAVRCIANNVPLNPFGLRRLLETGDAKADKETADFIIELFAKGGALVPEHKARTIREYAIRRALYEACQGAMADAATDDADRSAADRVEALETRLFELSEFGGSRPMECSLGEAFDAADVLIDRAQKAPDGVAGVPTGLIDLDRRLGGLYGSELYVIAGRPGMGKTAMGLNIAVNAARQGRKVRFVSLEMSHGQLAQRYYARHTGISIQAQRRALNQEHFRQLGSARAAFSELPLVIDYRDGQTVTTIRSGARRQKRREGLDLLIIDYLGLIKATDGQAKKVYQIEEITTGLKQLSRELDIPVVLLSQLNRGVEQRDDKRPSLSDLRDSGAIEQDADVVMLLYREEYYLQRDEPKDPSKQEAWMDRMEKARGRADVIVAKFRQGETGTVAVHFDGARQRFGNLSEER